MNAQTTYLASKPHYEILDGLRGVALFHVSADSDFIPASKEIGCKGCSHDRTSFPFLFFQDILCHHGPYLPLPVQ